MRFLSTVVVAAFCTVLSGCNRTTQPSGQATVTTMGYTFLFETGGDRPFAVDGHRASTKGSDGKETDLDEDITIAYAGQTARIVNGKFTLGGKERGTVNPGDKIAFTPSGGVSVNGVER